MSTLAETECDILFFVDGISQYPGYPQSVLERRVGDLVFLRSVNNRIRVEDAEGNIYGFVRNPREVRPFMDGNRGIGIIEEPEWFAWTDPGDKPGLPFRPIRSAI